MIVNQAYGLALLFVLSAYFLPRPVCTYDVYYDDGYGMPDNESYYDQLDPYTAAYYKRESGLIGELEPKTWARVEQGAEDAEPGTPQPTQNAEALEASVWATSLPGVSVLTALNDDYDSSLAHPLWPWDNCEEVLDTGEPILNGTIACDVELQGVDEHADTLPGGVDGVYQLAGCSNGKARFVRKGSPEDEPRSLWFNYMHGDWQFVFGDDPVADNMIMYGTPLGQISPLDVSAWHLAAVYVSRERGGLGKLGGACRGGQGCEAAAQQDDEEEGEELYMQVLTARLSCVGGEGTGHGFRIDDEGDEYLDEDEEERQQQQSKGEIDDRARAVGAQLAAGSQRQNGQQVGQAGQGSQGGTTGGGRGAAAGASGSRQAGAAQPGKQAGGVSGGPGGRPAGRPARKAASRGKAGARQRERGKDEL